MDLEDGHAFIRILAAHIHSHEKSLAQGLQKQSRHAQTRQARPPSVAGSANEPPPPTAQSRPSASSGLASTLSALGLSSKSSPQVRLLLTPNQLYYLLSRFDELGVYIGAMNVRLENIGLEHTSSNYVSFLPETKRSKRRVSDQDSIHSVSSVRSVMSSVSTMWNNLGLGSAPEAKAQKRRAAELEDLRYLYSAFTKMPGLKLTIDHRIRRIAGWEEFPFDTAVPFFVFKNLSYLEIIDVDFRSIYGWDRLADQLRQLTVKRAALDDPAELLINIVLDDKDGRRRRSAKNHTSPIMTYASAGSPSMRHAELSRSMSTPSTSVDDYRRGPGTPPLADGPLAALRRPPTSSQQRKRSTSPPRPSSARRASAFVPNHPVSRARRSSGSSTSSPPTATPRTSSSNLLIGSSVFSKWELLRHLSLADNALTSLNGAGLMPLTTSLQSLDVSGNLFAQVPDSLAMLTSLRALNLSNCMIDSLHSLTRHPLPAIITLNLKGNRLVSLAGIEKLVSLERLDVRENKLGDPTELARLTGMPNFREVYVEKNPFTKTYKDSYRVTILNLFRRSPGYTDDILVDTKPPSYGERRRLIDRVPETATVPVVKAPLDDELVDEAHVREANAESETISLSQKRPSLDAQPGLSYSEQKRRTPRRRVVDMSATGSPTPPSNPRLSLEASPEATNVAAGQIISAAQPKTPENRAPKRVGHSEPQTNGGSVHPATYGNGKAVRTDLSAGNEQYRQRVQMLQNGYGAGLGGMLPDDSWSEPSAKDVPFMNGNVHAPFPPMPVAEDVRRAVVVADTSSHRQLGG